MQRQHPHGVLSCHVRPLCGTLSGYAYLSCVKFQLNVPFPWGLPSSKSPRYLQSTSCQRTKLSLTPCLGWQDGSALHSSTLWALTAPAPFFFALTGFTGDPHGTQQGCGRAWADSPAPISVLPHKHASAVELGVSIKVTLVRGSIREGNVLVVAPSVVVMPSSVKRGVGCGFRTWFFRPLPTYYHPGNSQVCSCGTHRDHHVATAGDP